MPSGKPLSFLSCLFLFLIIYSCATPSDIYARVPRNSKLSEELLRDALQIYPYKEGLMLLYDSNPSIYSADYYLLFFDSSSILEGAVYLAGSGVLSFSDNEIISVKDPLYNEREPSRIDHLPARFKVDMLEWVKTYSVYNKFVSQLDFLPADSLKPFRVKLIFYQGIENYYFSEKELSQEKRRIENVEAVHDLRDLYFDYEGVYTLCQSQKGNFLSKNHYKLKPIEKEKLYQKVLKYLADRGFDLAKD